MIIVAATIWGGLLGAITGFVIVYCWYIRTEGDAFFGFYIALGFGVPRGAVCGLIGGIITVEEER